MIMSKSINDQLFSSGNGYTQTKCLHQIDIMRHSGILTTMHISAQKIDKGDNKFHKIKIQKFDLISV